MKAKRFIAIVLSLLMISIMVACGGEAGDIDVGVDGENGGSPGNVESSDNGSGGDASPSDNGSVNTDNSGDENIIDSGNVSPSDNGSEGNGENGNGSGSAGNNGGNSSGNSGGGGNSGGSSSGGGDNSSGNGGSNSGGNGGSSGGGSGGGSSSGLSGTPEEILNNLIAAISAMGVDMPMSLPPDAVLPELSQNTIGLSEADFGRLVQSASYNLAGIGTFAHQIIIIQAKDAASATEVKKLVSGDGGYDSKKWICVFPEKTIAVESGVYVLLIASYKNVVDAAVKSFEAAAGSIGSVVTIWEFAGDELPPGGGGFGGGAPITW